MFQILAKIQPLSPGGAAEVERIARENVLNPLHDRCKVPLSAIGGQ